MRKLLITLAAVLCFVAIGAALAAEKHDAGRLRSELEKAPAKATAQNNPFAGQPSAIAAGAKLFERYCSECHSEAGKGRHRGPNLMTPEVQGAPAGAIAWYLKNGNLGSGMPSWSRLPEQQRWQIVAYLKSAKTSARP